MVSVKTKRLGREDWIRGGLELLGTSGIEKVKIVPLAEKLGVTSGSFYWHFTNRRQLYNELLEYWEREMTDKAIEQAKHFAGPPKERILLLMEHSMYGTVQRCNQFPSALQIPVVQASDKC